MTRKKLHPSVEQFKQFVKANPALIKEIRSGNSTLQELYEDWYLLGEEDSRWDPYRSTEKKEQTTNEKPSDWMTKIMDSVKRMDPNQMQGYVSNLSKTLASIQGVLAQFQSNSPVSPPASGVEKIKNPFVFNKD